MELQQLIYFKAVADTKNLSKASRSLYLTQPALSKSIAALERELGTPLFDRQRRQMLLNDYGRVFYNRTRRILNELDFAVQEVHQLSHQAQMVLTISTEMPELFCPIAAAYHGLNPHVMIQEYSSPGVSTREALVFGNIRFCLTSKPYDHPSLIWFPLCEDEMLLITPRQWSQGSQGFARLDEFSKMPFITTAMGTSLHQYTTAFCKTAHFEPNVSIISPEIETIPMLVSSGCGCAFMSSLVHQRASKPRMDPERPPYRVVHSTEPPCFRNIGIAIQRDTMLTDMEYDFLLFLSSFFSPDYPHAPASSEKSLFLAFLQNHHEASGISPAAVTEP